MDKPEDPQRPRPPEPPKTYVSPKRRNLDFDEEPESGSKAQNVVAIVMLVAIVGLGAVLWTSMQKSKAESKVKAAEATRVAAEQARKDSLEKHTSDSLFAARQDSLNKEEAKHPKPKTAPPTATAATNPGGGGTPAATPATPPPPASKFAIDVGSFLNQERASSEQTKLQTSTGLNAKVEPVSEGGVTSYRIVLGEFTSRGEAEKKANALIVAQTIKEAHVIKLKAGS